MSDLRIELYQDTAGEYRWRAVAGNGEVVADSGEGFRSKQSAQENVATNYGRDIVVVDVTLEP